MRIACWNLNQGGASRARSRILGSLAPDLVLLQEAKKPTEGNMAWEPVEHGKWGSAAIVTSGSLRPIPIDGYAGWVVGGEWLGSACARDGRRLFVFSLHSPTGTKTAPRGSYVKEVESIFIEIKAKVPVDADLVVGGDFNFLSLGERKRGEALKTTTAERRALGAIERMGLVSCWESAHPNAPLAQTLRRRDRSRAFHCDGIFVSKRRATGALCEVVESPEVVSESDHNPIAAWLS